MWAHEHADAVSLLLAAVAPLLEDCEGRELLTIATAARAMGTAPPAAFASALSAAVAGAAAGGRLAGGELEGTRTALAALEERGRAGRQR